MNAQFKNVFTQLSSWLVVVLFLYTASDKLANLSEFKDFLSRLEYVGQYHLVLAIVIPVAEIAIAVMLLMPSFRMEGLCAALLLMLCFTIYLVYMKLTRSELPCHCGGAISRLSWLQHIWFNILIILLMISSLFWIPRPSSLS